jgi:hypothetical protein
MAVILMWTRQQHAATTITVNSLSDVTNDIHHKSDSNRCQ